MSYCCNKCLISKEIQDDFMQWLVEILGPVLTGSKPAEILSFSNYDIKSSEKLEKIEFYIGNCNKILHKTIRYNKNSVKVLFYNSLTLDKTLQEPKNYIFLKKTGYPVKYDMEIYIDFIVKKIQRGYIPDEIGIFLGYPLKDIIGFIGHPALKLTKVNGWRVYGNPRISDERHELFLNGRKKIKELLLTNTAENILFSY